MPRLVMKFGGTSVADIQRIRNVAAHVKREIDAGSEVAVVVSAMAGKTNELVAWCKEAGSHFDNAEYDAVVASGELVTAGLLALVLKDMGLKARSWAGWQIPLVTDDAHGSARIAGIDGTRLGEGFAAGEIAVVAGFQGVHKATNRVTTLGRGGSDTSAVALAAAISADRCDIYTDVDGVYTSDPRVVPKARRLAKVAFEEMLEMASLGAKVLQVRSVELAMVNKVRLYVRSSFDDPAHPQLGTLICDEEEIMEQEVVTGIAFSRDEAQITLRDVADKPGVAAAIFVPLADANINVDMIIQVVSDDTTTTDITFTVPAAEYERAMSILEGAASEDRLRQAARRAGRGEDLGDRRRHALAFRRRRARLQGAGREGHQHPRHHHVGNQVLDADRRRLYRARGAHAAHALRAGCEVSTGGCRPRAQKILRADLSERCALVSAQRRDAQDLAGVDLVGVGQHRAVGLEDDVVLPAGALAVFSLGNRPQRVAALDRIELRFGRGGGRLDVVLHRLHADGVAERDGDLFGLFRVRGAARHMHLVPVDRDLHVRRVEAMFLELLLQRVGRRRLRLAGAE